MLTSDLIKSKFEYCSTGRLISKKYNRPVGRIKNGYRNIYFMGKEHKEHRLIYIMHHGSINGVIDHVNRNKLDNRIENLRDCTVSQNMANVKNKGCHIKKGHKTKPYYASIKINKKTIYLGYYATEQEAMDVYIKKHIELFGEYSIYYDRVQTS